MDGQDANPNHGFNQQISFLPDLDVEPDVNFRPVAGGNSIPDPFPVLNSSFTPGADNNPSANIGTGVNLNHNNVSGQHDENFSLDGFDPSQINSDSINAMNAADDLPALNLDMLNNILQEPGAASQMMTGGYQNQAALDAASSVASAGFALPDDGLNLQNQPEANVYSLANNRFPGIGTYYQSLYQSPNQQQLPQTYAVLPNQTFGMGPIFHFLQQPEAADIAGDMDNIANGGEFPMGSEVDPVDPKLPPAGYIPPEFELADPVDGLFSDDLPLYGQNLTEGATTSAWHGQNDNVYGNDSISPTLLHTKVPSNVNGKRPLELVDDESPESAGKRRKFAEIPPHPRAASRKGLVIARNPQSNNSSGHATPLGTRFQQPAMLQAQVLQPDLQQQMLQYQQQQPPLVVFKTTTPSSAQNPSDSDDGELLYANYGEAQNAATNRQLPHNWTPCTTDPTISSDGDGQRERYISELVNAFNDTSNCIDAKPNDDSFHQKWAVIAATNTLSVDELIETICWELLNIAEQLHRDGPISLNVFDKTKLRDIKKFKDLTFENRIGEVCTLLKVSKNRCAKLLKSEGLHMIVAIPAQLEKQTTWNKKQNTARQASLQAGREAEKRKRPIASEADGEEVEKAPKRKRSRRSAMPAQGTSQANTDAQAAAQLLPPLLPAPAASPAAQPRSTSRVRRQKKTLGPMAQARAQSPYYSGYAPVALIGAGSATESESVSATAADAANLLAGIAATDPGRRRSRPAEPVVDDDQSDSSQQNKRRRTR